MSSSPFSRAASFAKLPAPAALDVREDDLLRQLAADAREPRGEAAIGRRRERRRGIAIARDRGGGDERDERKEAAASGTRRAEPEVRGETIEASERAVALLEERARARVTMTQPTSRTRIWDETTRGVDEYILAAMIARIESESPSTAFALPVRTRESSFTRPFTLPSAFALI